MTEALRLRLPATSANLGPGFDTVGLALGLFLDIVATPAAVQGPGHLNAAGSPGHAGDSVPAGHSIQASGRGAEIAGAIRGNLILDTYASLAPAAPALALRLQNGIPLGMGCGSSAAALLAGVLLANHFGHLGMTPEACCAEACRREGHPDNVAACFFGGFTAAAIREDGAVDSATFGVGLPWRLLLAVPSTALSTREARALLPDGYSRAETVGSLQSTALLVAAFAAGRPELLRQATRDCLHQPYRAQACPLLPKLLPLAGQAGIYSVTLSGAGPSVLLICDPQQAPEVQAARVREAAGEPGLEVLLSGIAGGAQWAVGGGPLRQVT